MRLPRRFNIANYAYIQAHAQPQQQQCAVHTLADICQPGNRERVTRILDAIHAAVVEMLHPYTKTPAESGTTINDDLAETPAYVIDMQIPDTFSQTTLRLLSRAIHEYMVCCVLYDWLSIIAPQDPAMPHWLAKAQEAEDAIGNAKSQGRTVFTRPLHP